MDLVRICWSFRLQQTDIPPQVKLARNKTIFNQSFFCKMSMGDCALKTVEESDVLHSVECNAYRLRIEFLEETIHNYRSMPADLLGSFDVSNCLGNSNNPFVTIHKIRLLLFIGIQPQTRPGLRPS